MIKKISCFILVAILSTFCACVNSGCGNTNNEGSNPPAVDLPNYTLDEYEFSTIFIDGNQKTLPKFVETDTHEDGCVEYNVSVRVGDKNYFKFEISTDVDLVGYINYYSVDDRNVENSEKFFISAGKTEFTTFLDAFRVGARGAFGKVISTVTFQSVDETKEGTFALKSIKVSDRTIDTDEQWTITNGDMLMGTSPFYGGCVTRLEKLDQDVYEYIDFDGNVVIDRYVDPDYDAQTVISDRVNFINIYDLGREVQPSYYSRVTESNRYTPDYDPEDKDSYYSGLEGVQYNPIQCGDFGGHTPQIIDYVWKEDYLYVKMKAQEWFFYTNIQANGYIEATYYFDEGGAVIVDNVYTDFSCFVGEKDLQVSSQETPATYFVYPLNYFYCETKQGVIYDDNLSDISIGHQGKASLKSQVSGDYFYAIKEKYMIGDWCAFVNSEQFGVGIYMPNADIYNASRGRKSNNYYSETQNSQFNSKFFDFDEADYIPSYAAMNYNYVNPALHRTMVDFVPLKYSYALYIGDTTEMKTVFNGLSDDNILTNAHLLDENQGWPS